MCIGALIPLPKNLAVQKYDISFDFATKKLNFNNF